VLALAAVVVAVGKIALSVTLTRVNRFRRRARVYERRARREHRIARLARFLELEGARAEEATYARRHVFAGRELCRNSISGRSRDIIASAISADNRNPSESD